MGWRLGEGKGEEELGWGWGAPGSGLSSSVEDEPRERHGLGLVSEPGGWASAVKTKLTLSAHSLVTSLQTLQGSGHKAGRPSASFMGPKLQGGGN